MFKKCLTAQTINVIIAMHEIQTAMNLKIFELM